MNNEKNNTQKDTKDESLKQPKDPLKQKESKGEDGKVENNSDDIIDNNHNKEELIKRICLLSQDQEYSNYKNCSLYQSLENSSLEKIQQIYNQKIILLKKEQLSNFNNILDAYFQNLEMTYSVQQLKQKILDSKTFHDSQLHKINLELQSTKHKAIDNIIDIHRKSIFSYLEKEKNSNNDPSFYVKSLKR